MLVQKTNEKNPNCLEIPRNYRVVSVTGTREYLNTVRHMASASGPLNTNSISGRPEILITSVNSYPLRTSKRIFITLVRKTAQSVEILERKRGHPNEYSQRNANGSETNGTDVRGRYNGENKLKTIILTCWLRIK